MIDWKKFFNDLNLTELVEGDDYYAIIYDNEILTCSNSPVSYVLDSHDIELNKDGIYFDGEQLTTGDEFAFVVFNSDYTVKLVKKNYFFPTDCCGIVIMILTIIIK